MENGEINIVVEEPREEEEGEGKNEATNEETEEEQGIEPREREISQLSPRDRNTLSSSPHSFNERTPLLGVSAPQGGLYSSSWSTTVGPSPYTSDNKPKRRPFHRPSVGSMASEVTSPERRESENLDRQLYTRYRYYSRLRASVQASEHALVIPDHIVPPELFLPYIPGHVRDADGKQSSYITIIAIWNTMMGTSLMTMPWAFGQAGFVGGIIIMLGMAGIALYTAIRLLTLQKTMGLEGPSLELSRLCWQLLGGTLGRLTEGLTVTFSVITLVGAQVVYWVLMSNFLFNTGEVIYDTIHGEIHNDSSSAVLCPPNITNDENIKGPEPSEFHKWWQQDLTVPLYLLVPFVFVLNLRDAKIFTYFNSLGAISVLVMYLFVISKAATWGININFTDVTSDFYVPLFKSSFMCLTGTLSLAYFIHNCVVTIMQGNRHQENNVRDLSIAYILVALTYIPIGVLFYSAFPMPKYCVVDNFLDNFPPHDVVLAVVRGFLFFQILTVYPLLGFFIRNQLFTYFMGPSYEYRLWQVFLLNTCLLTMSVLVAIFYPNIGFIIRWVGAISGLAYIFMLPCATYMYALYTQDKLQWYHCIIHFAIIFIGIGNFISQFLLG
ncbi:neutral amino acid transporter 9 [Penaeus vannamei]|uniref:Putative sodium-coupled neutral amino acid transporter 9 isoform X2 n=1 Tax=Penaeus vannamei TaxID=6689 RepID=A0A3R7MYI6_PENVA|nr:sodium-coupled neutral amino acid transporter 9-like [Penaeus vannamei]XP_027217847.1 sodium-coupled neutral amino acid transporter 9-like [Penaeus vannamei]ROT72766.1 putative sodium-coupled neutral amino acid transporter 9 isoform X2 [Penaeus vannamei]